VIPSAAVLKSSRYLTPQVATSQGQTDMKIRLRIMILSLGVAGALFMATGCGNKPAPTSVTTQVAPKMKMTTDIPPEITTPDSVDTRIGPLKFFDGFPDDKTTQLVTTISISNVECRHSYGVYRARRFKRSFQPPRSLVAWMAT
jgi:hypothetical protein